MRAIREISWHTVVAKGEEICERRLWLGAIESPEPSRYERDHFLAMKEHLSTGERTEDHPTVRGC